MVRRGKYIPIERSSGNVFADIRLPNADHLLAYFSHIARNHSGTDDNPADALREMLDDPALAEARQSANSRHFPEETMMHLGELLSPPPRRYHRGR